MAHTASLQSTAASVCLTDRLERSSLDNRSYKVIVLPNKLEALLIHDPDTDKASASLDVNVGSLKDPKQLEGLFHGIEHALFMGTEKYPIENDYAQYLAKHSGHSNAYTAPSSTNYQFEVAAVADSEEKATGVPSKESPFYGALDRFAQFFIAPLFLADTLDRELRAVDSENKKNLQSDVWRLQQLERSLSNPDHPINNFSTGNLETLRDGPAARGVQIRDEFMRYYKEEYSANRMKLVVLGRESLEQLQEWVEELFSAVPNQDLLQHRWDDIPVYTSNELLTQTFVKPVMDQRILKVNFLYQDEDEMYETRPHSYIGHLIAHEGPGSMLSYIKAKGWADGLRAGAQTVCRGSGLFKIDITLTPDGLKNYEEIIKTVFQYIAVLREEGPKEWIFNEIELMEDVEFRFQQKRSAFSTTRDLASDMQSPLPREALLKGSISKSRFDPTAITEALSLLNPNNFRFTIITQEPLQGEVQKEPWYGTEYTVDKIPSKLIEEIKTAAAAGAASRPVELHLPAKNEFIPTNFDVDKKDVKNPAKTPKLIRDDEAVRVWFKKDDQFWVPKANIKVLLRTPVCDVSPRTRAIASLFTDLLEDSLTEYAYNAELAGLEYSVSSTSRGLEIAVVGYNDKLMVLLEKVLITLRELELKQNRFDIMKERMTRAYSNWQFSSPYQLISTYSRWLSVEKGVMPEQYLAELPSIELEDIKAFHPVLLEQAHLEVLVHGNVHRKDALEITRQIESQLQVKKLAPSHWPLTRSLRLPEGSKFCFARPLRDPSNINHCIQYVLSVGDNKDMDLSSKIKVLAQMTHEPAFDQLRTKEQLGYIVFSGQSSTSTTIGYQILIQSEKTPEYLEGRIESFLTKFKTILADMTDADVEGHKRAVITALQEKLKNLDQETARFWNHISSDIYQFNRTDELVEHIRVLKKDDMIKFFDRYIDPASSARANLSVHLRAAVQSKEEAAQKTEISGEPEVSQIVDGQALTQTEKPNTAILITDVQAFKASLSLTAAASPIRDLREYEELETKL